MNIITEIKTEYKRLGRNPNKLQIENKTKEELHDILEKIKAINYSFGLLFSEEQGVDLAKEILNSVFIQKNG